MEIGVGLDQGLQLSFPEQRQVIREAVALGYRSAWTPAGLGFDAFQICGQWCAEATAAGSADFTADISVLPVPLLIAQALAAVA